MRSAKETVQSRLTETRILYLAVGVFDKGGISRYCRYQISALRKLVGKQNIQVLSFFGPGPNDFEEPFEVDYYTHGPGLLSDFNLLAASLRTARDFRPTVIWSSHVHLTPTALLARRLLGNASVVVNVYGRELWSARQWLHRRTLRRADLIVSDCYFSAEFVESQYALDRERICVVHDCVDTERFRPAPRNPELLKSFGIPNGGDHRYIMTFGRIETRSQYKGYDRLLDALISLKGDERVIGLFAGDGDDRARLEKRAMQAGLNHRVFFLGSISEATLVDVYNLADVFVLVSERAFGRGEGLPLTPLEAAACGKPIIVGDEDGSREAVIDNLNGRTISPSDASGLRSVLVELLSDNGLREQMGYAARVQIEKHFSYEAFEGRTANVLTKLFGFCDQIQPRVDKYKRTDYPQTQTH
jgi:phosphatidylinositol alpha-1,6-mannosyltransferase